jgi:hypothetical protein
LRTERWGTVTHRGQGAEELARKDTSEREGQGSCKVIEIQKGDSLKEEGWSCCQMRRGRREEILKGACGFAN